MNMILLKPGHKSFSHPLWSHINRLANKWAADVKHHMKCFSRSTQKPLETWRLKSCHSKDGQQGELYFQPPQQKINHTGNSISNNTNLESQSLSTTFYNVRWYCMHDQQGWLTTVSPSWTTVYNAFLNLESNLASVMKRDNDNCSLRKRQPDCCLVSVCKSPCKGMEHC